MSPPPQATNIETSLRDNKDKYIYYQQFGLRVLDFVNKNYPMINYH